MRIVGGRLRGRRLEAPGGMTLRPTADRTREALFNILCQGKLDWRPSKQADQQEDAAAPGGNPLAGARVLDAFAGTGALGLEALSRGAGFVTFMENQAAALNACRHNIDALDPAAHGAAAHGEAAQTELLRCDVLRPPPAKGPCELVLMDPPYNQDLAPPALAALHRAGWLAPGALATIELMATEPFTPPEGFETLDERKYGKARLVFLRAPG